MKKAIIIAVVMALVLTSVGFWMYWEWDMSIDALLPEYEWHVAALVGIELHDGAAEHVRYTVDEESSGIILTLLDTVKVNRTAEDGFSAFWLVLCSQGHEQMVSITVCENGLMEINGQNYEGGEDFCAQLQQLAQTLPAEE